jgi:hypothetical protein
MKNFLVKYIVTRSFFPSIMMILGVTFLFALGGFIFLWGEGRLSQENWYSLIINTAKFSMWFFLGYGGIQAFGVRLETEKLKDLEDAKYLAHARADFEPWTEMNRNLQDQKTLEDIQKIDEQRVRISGDDKTAFWLFSVGVTLFVLTSLIELLYPAFK